MIRLKHHRFMILYAKNLMYSIVTRPAFLFLGVMTLSVMIFFSVLIHQIESGVNPSFDRYLDSAFYTVSTMTSVGMANLHAATDAGKWVSMAMMMIGTFLFVSFTGVVASTVLELELQVKDVENDRRNKKD